MSGRLNDRSVELVQGAIERFGSVQAVATKIGYARSSLSLAMSGRYVGSLDKMELAIAAELSVAVACPHLGRSISGADCRNHRTRPIPTANPVDLKFWRACRYCPLNPDARVVVDADAAPERSVA